jgi:hypothetical protein
MTRRTETIEAWHLHSGDELPGGVRVLTVNREAVRRTVRVVTDEPASADLPGDSPIAVVRRIL